MQTICWKGEDSLNWRAEMGILDQTPAVLSLAYEKNGVWTVLEENLVPEFHVVTSKRTKNNPQRNMALKEGEESGYQWDTYSDDPFSHLQDVKHADEKFLTTSMNVHAAVAMSSVAILAHRSVMSGGNTYDIPDFRLEECRKAYENDRESPFYREDGTAPTIPCCSHPDFKPTPDQVERYRLAMTDGKDPSDEIL